MKVERNLYKVKVDRIMKYLIGKDKVMLDLDKEKKLKGKVKKLFC